MWDSNISNIIIFQMDPDWLVECLDWPALKEGQDMTGQKLANWSIVNPDHVTKKTQKVKKILHILHMDFHWEIHIWNVGFKRFKRIWTDWLNAWTGQHQKSKRRSTGSRLTQTVAASHLVHALICVLYVLFILHATASLWVTYHISVCTCNTLHFCGYHTTFRRVTHCINA